MNFDINDFLQYAQAGTAPTVYSRQKEENKIAVTHTNRGISTTIKYIPSLLQAAKSATPPPHHTVAATETQKPALELVMYSERSFAIFGDTKPIQAKLESLFGKFNRYLKKEGVATPGYIFSIGRLDTVKKSLNLQDNE